jgi:hypothetical protein
MCLWALRDSSVTSASLVVLGGLVAILVLVAGSLGIPTPWALLDHKTRVDRMIFRVQTRLTWLFERFLLTSLIFLKKIRYIFY